MKKKISLWGIPVGAGLAIIVMAALDTEIHLITFIWFAVACVIWLISELVQ